MFTKILSFVRGPIVALALTLLTGSAFALPANANGFYFSASCSSDHNGRFAYQEGFRDGYRRGFWDGREDAREDRRFGRERALHRSFESWYDQGFEAGYERGYRNGYISISRHDRDDDDRDWDRH